MPKYVMEFIGTFFLVLVITVTGRLGEDAGVLVPLAIGAVLMVMVYAGGHISGAHYNPAVSLAILLRGRMKTSDLGPYVLIQLAAAAAAAGVAFILVETDPTALSIAGEDVPAALLAEFLFTFALAFVVLNVATSKDHPNNSFYGLAIGFTVLAGAVTVGGISGGAFNPAVALGISIAGMTEWANIWIYLVADLAGAVVAAVAFRAVNPQDLAPMEDMEVMEA